MFFFICAATFWHRWNGKWNINNNENECAWSHFFNKIACLFMCTVQWVQFAMWINDGAALIMWKMQNKYYLFEVYAVCAHTLKQCVPGVQNFRVYENRLSKRFSCFFFKICVLHFSNSKKFDKLSWEIWIRFWKQYKSIADPLKHSFFIWWGPEWPIEI